MRACAPLKSSDPQLSATHNRALPRCPESAPASRTPGRLFGGWVWGGGAPQTLSQSNTMQSDYQTLGGLRSAFDVIPRALSRLTLPVRFVGTGEGVLGFVVVCIIGTLVGAFLYINQSSQRASTNFDIRELDSARGRLEREQQQLASDGAQLRAFGRIELEATTRLGMVPAPSPDYVRSRRAPFDIDARLREAEARAHSQQPTIDDRLSRWFHLSVVSFDENVHTEDKEQPPFPSMRRAWAALTGMRADPSTVRNGVASRDATANLDAEPPVGLAGRRTP